MLFLAQFIDKFARGGLRFYGNWKEKNIHLKKNRNQQLTVVLCNEYIVGRIRQCAQEELISTEWKLF